MPIRTLSLLFLTLTLAACSSTPSSFSNAYVSGYSIAKPISCVPYARDKSGIQIRGDAHTWWWQAQGRFRTGNAPYPGAVYVLSQTQKLRHGHLSVVTRVLDSRHIEVTHSNWGSDKRTRSIIYDRMRVEDISPNNDWSRARFWNKDTNAYGSPYAASGFIYRH